MPSQSLRLPFANLSEDPQQQYFADGITEDLTTELSRPESVFLDSGLNPRNLITVAAALTAGTAGAGDLTLKFDAFTRWRGLALQRSAP